MVSSIILHFKKNTICNRLSKDAHLLSPILLLRNNGGKNIFWGEGGYAIVCFKSYKRRVVCCLFLNYSGMTMATEIILLFFKTVL